MGKLKAHVMTGAGTRVNKVDVEVRPLIKKLAEESPPVDPRSATVSVPNAPTHADIAPPPAAESPPAVAAARAPTPSTPPRTGTKPRAVGKSRLLGRPTPGKSVPPSPRKPSGMRFGSQRRPKTRP